LLEMRIQRLERALLEQWIFLNKGK
jgi:hypothetical protein